MLEILSSELTKDQKDDFAAAFSHRGLDLIDVDRRISGKASIIRQFYDDRVFNSDGSVKSGRIMGMGDSIHLASAIHFEMAEMQTLDGLGKRKRKYNLLQLDGDVAGARLSIKMPKYLAPPEPLKGPLTPISGKQSNLFDEVSPAIPSPFEDRYRFRPAPEIPRPPYGVGK